MIRSIIFDLDGTLVHSLSGIAASLNRSLQQLNLPTHSDANVRKFIGDGVRKLVERGAPKASLTEINQLLQLFKADYAKTWQHGTSPYPGVIKTLQQLNAKNIPCAVLSNKPDEYCREITDHIFPDSHFTIVRGQLEGIAAKPDPTAALAICNQQETPPQQTAFIGDSTIDLETAHNAGMIAVAVTWGYHDPSTLSALNPKHTLKNIAELPRLITN